jgi:hypothetical protein
MIHSMIVIISFHFEKLILIDNNRFKNKIHLLIIKGFTSNVQQYVKIVI